MPAESESAAQCALLSDRFYYIQLRILDPLGVKECHNSYGELVSTGWD